MIIGITTTELSDGATTNPIQINGEDYTAVTGDVVVYGNPLSGEYSFNGTSWDLIGTGSSASPFIVLSWGDYLQVRPQTVATDTYIKFGNLNIENGAFVGSGGGTTDNPFICNTFEEVCVALGCNKIWQADIYDDCEDTDKMKIYHYNGRYAKHVRTPTTIDLEEYLDSDDVTTLNIGGVVNFNGWTLTNIRCININGFWRMYKVTGVIITNFVYECDDSNWDVFYSMAYIQDSMIQIHLSMPIVASMSYKIQVFSYRSGGSKIKKSSIDVSGICNEFALCESSSTASNECWIYDSTVNFNLSVKCLNEYNKGRYFNTKLTGKINTVQGSTGAGSNHILGRSFTDSIIDVEIENVSDNKTFITTDASYNANNLYNSDKLTVGSGITGFTGISTESLESAEDIAATGFPIGVD